MYEAIVVLPLLGAVIAGLITLVGARNRLPGEDPPPPHDDHAAPLVPEHIHGAPHPDAPHAEIGDASHEAEEAGEPSAGSQAMSACAAMTCGSRFSISSPPAI
jgi:NADH-quinone oxidoreductase subunit L